MLGQGGFRREAARLARRLFAPADIAGLVAYRIAFGLLAFYEVWRFAAHGWIDRYYVDPGFHFSYYGFGWLQPWPGDGMHWHFGLLGVLSLCIVVGFCYRAAAALFWLAFTYTFLLEKATYLNHLYLFCLIAFLMIFVPAHRAASVDAKLRPGIRSENAPIGTWWLLRFQMGVVYTYAGFAKMNGDWLQGWPLRLWLPPESGFPVIGRFFDELWFQLFFSYGGLFLDTLAPFALLWRRTRWPTLALLLLFHLTNKQLFGIGIFPLLSIATTLCFLPPDWPRRVFNWPRRSPAPDGVPPAGPLGGRQRLWVAFVVVWVLSQLLIPFRHVLYPGNVSWTEEGHNFAWHQKLRDKDGDADFYVTDKTSGETWEVRQSEFLSSRQRRKMSTRPHMLLEFAHHLKRHYSETEGREVEVRARVSCSLNGRRRQLLIDPAVDLAAQPRNLWPKPWIIPLTATWNDDDE